jgi:hypothetical protein
MKTNQPKLRNLEDDQIWLESCDLAEYVYNKLPNLPAEERWSTASKLRNSANDLIYWVALAVSNSAPSATEYEWASARKHASALKTMYRFACRQKFIELDPEIMVRFKKLLKQIDQEITEAYKQTEVATEKEMKPWLEKYALWKEMQNEN